MKYCNRWGCFTFLGVISLETTTTEWHSSFDLYNGYSGLWPNSYNLLIRSGSTYYAFSSAVPLTCYSSSESFRISPAPSAGCYYNESRGHWFSTGVSSVWRSDTVVLAQSSDSSAACYFTNADFISGAVPCPSGNAFDSLYSESALSQVLLLLPLLLVVSVGFIGIRKGVHFLCTLFGGDRS